MADKTESNPQVHAAPPSTASARCDDPTLLETEERKAFDPRRYQTHEVDLEVRKAWLATELPSIDLAALQDTVPPNATRQGPAAPPQPAAEHRPGELITQPLATPAQVLDAPAPASEQQTAPSLKRVKREAAELSAVLGADSRRRRTRVAVIVGLFFVLGVGVFALLGQAKDPVPDRAAPTSATENEPATQPTLSEPQKPVLADSTSSVDSPASAPHLGETAPVAQAPMPKVVASAGTTASGAPPVVTHRDSVALPRVNDPQPPAPTSTVPSASPARPVGPTPKVPPTRGADGVRETPVNPGLE